MPKQKNSPTGKKILALYGIIAVLVALCGVLALGLAHRTEANTQKRPSVSLGAMQYDFSSGKAVKRNDAAVNELRLFLEADAAHEGCSPQSPAYEHVAAYTKDETQVFIKYGCGAADSPIYAVKTAGVWKLLSPTNHFDGFGIPDCDYLNSNTISKEIAPVCVNGAETGTPKYTVR
jgi:hypothetical protein